MKVKSLTQLYRQSKFWDNLTEIIDASYKKYNYVPENVANESLFGSYIMLGELLDPNHTYEYKKKNGNVYSYADSDGNNFNVRVYFQPYDGDFFEVKAYWIDPKTNKPIYNEFPPNSTSRDWDKKSNTVAKIYRDEILPFFKNQELSNLLVFKPMDAKRYQLSIRMVKKFNTDNYKIIEDFPKQITIVKEDKNV